MSSLVIVLTATLYCKVTLMHTLVLPRLMGGSNLSLHATFPRRRRTCDTQTDACTQNQLGEPAYSTCSGRILHSTNCGNLRMAYSGWRAQVTSYTQLIEQTNSGASRFRSTKSRLGDHRRQSRQNPSRPFVFPTAKLDPSVAFHG